MVLICSWCRKRKKKERRGRHFWIWPLFADRAISGAYQSLVPKTKEIYTQKIFGFVHMSSNWLDNLLELIKPMIMTDLSTLMDSLCVTRFYCLSHGLMVGS